MKRVMGKNKIGEEGYIELLMRGVEIMNGIFWEEFFIGIRS